MLRRPNEEYLVKVFWAQSSMSGDASEHSRTNLVSIMECINKIGPPPSKNTSSLTSSSLTAIQVDKIKKKGGFDVYRHQRNPSILSAKTFFEPTASEGYVGRLRDPYACRLQGRQSTRPLGAVGVLGLDAGLD